MDAIIKFKNGVTASLNQDGWTCKDSDLAETLNLMFDISKTRPHDPNPIANLADYAARELGASIVQLPETEYQAGDIY